GPPCGSGRRSGRRESRCRRARAVARLGPVGGVDPLARRRASNPWNSSRSATGPDRGSQLTPRREPVMKAIAVVPGKPDSVHLADLAKPAVDDVPGGRGVLVKILRVGVDGTDKEINAAEYGAAPP